MEMPTLSPLALILLTALVSALAGYHVGKASGLRAAERAYRLTEKNTTQADPASAAKSAKGREKVVPAAVESGGEEDWESEDEDGEDSDVETVDVKKFENNHEPCKMVLVVRSDLGMTKGKIGAQCGHATLMCYKSSQKHAPQLIRSWEKSGQAKIAVQVKGGEDELMMLQAQAISLGVVAKIVHDAGRTQIAAGSATVLGIGPAPISVVDQISGHLKLL